MTRVEIQSFFPYNGTPIDFGAVTYAVPTLHWYREPFWNFFRVRLWSEGLDKWRVRWECRDFARAYASMALECWALTTATAPSEDDGLAVGEMWFIPNATKPTEGHAICPVFTENGLQFIDPQNNQLWPITPEQLSSRYFLRW